MSNVQFLCFWLTIILVLFGIFLIVRALSRISIEHSGRVSWRRALWQWYLMYYLFTGNREKLKELARTELSALPVIGYIGMVILAIGAIVGLISAALW